MVSCRISLRHTQISPHLLNAWGYFGASRTARPSQSKPFAVGISLGDFTSVFLLHTAKCHVFGVGHYLLQSPLSLLALQAYWLLKTQYCAAIIHGLTPPNLCTHHLQWPNPAHSTTAPTSRAHPCLRLVRHPKKSLLIPLLSANCCESSTSGSCLYYGSSILSISSTGRISL